MNWRILLVLITCLITPPSPSGAQPVQRVAYDYTQMYEAVNPSILVEPNTQFEDRLTQLDVRLTKIVRVGRARVRGMFDAYKLLNSDAILSDITRYGSSFLRPSAILGARLFKFGARLDF